MLNKSERRRLSHELQRMGLASLEDPALLQQLATIYNTHEKFRGMLMSVTPEKRAEAYNALRSRLCFQPKPLDVYEAEMRLIAEQKQLDIWDGTAYPKPFKVGEVETPQGRLERLASEAIRESAFEKTGRQLTLTCIKCTKVANFPARIRKDAERDSHNAGWRSDGRRDFCPECVPTRCTMAIECTQCQHVDRIRAWDEQDGYARARLAGWEIADAATCPRCVAMQNPTLIH